MVPSGGIAKRRFLPHGDYSNISNCQKNILAILRGTFTIFFCGISKQLCNYSTISLGPPNDVLWNPKVPRIPVWETLTQAIVLSHRAVWLLLNQTDFQTSSLPMLPTRLQLRRCYKDQAFRNSQRLWNLEVQYCIRIKWHSNEVNTVHTSHMCVQYPF